MHCLILPASCTQSCASAPNVRLCLRSRLLCRLEALYRKPLENIDHILIRNLPEIGVVVADSDKKVVLFETNDVVGLAAQLGNSARRSDWHRKDESLRLARADGAQRYPHRRTGGNAIVNHDRRAAGDLDTVAGA